MFRLPTVVTSHRGKFQYNHPQATMPRVAHAAVRTQFDRFDSTSIDGLDERPISSTKNVSEAANHYEYIR